jgi:hypothetical protein
VLCEADYDWTWPTKIDRLQVESVVRLDFIAEPRNVVLVAPQGLGKAMIAQNIAHNDVLAGHGVLFVLRLIHRPDPPAAPS